MPKHVSNTKGSLILGYLKDGSDDEHLGELVRLYYTCEFFSHSLFIVLSKNIPWLKVLILRMVPSPSSALKLILVNNISLFVSPHGISLLDGFPRLTINSSIR